jgi:hypothetical protein
LITLLKNFDIISFLHQKQLLGQVDPWRRTHEGNRIYTLLTTIDDALEQVRKETKQDISRTEFINHLKINDIYLFQNLDEDLRIQNKTTHLYGFNLAEFLQHHLMMGMLDDKGPIYGLLVPVDYALQEINEWAGQEIGRAEFLSYLKRNDVHVFNSIDDFVKAKEQVIAEGKYTEPKPKRRRQITDETRETLRKRMRDLNIKRYSKETSISE